MRSDSADSSDSSEYIDMTTAITETAVTDILCSVNRVPISGYLKVTKVLALTLYSQVLETEPPRMRKIYVHTGPPYDEYLSSTLCSEKIANITMYDAQTLSTEVLAMEGRLELVGRAWAEENMEFSFKISDALFVYAFGLERCLLQFAEPILECPIEVAKTPCTHAVFLHR
ncbi:hypothetical protein GMRT_10923 [Giardia muris]|uniref:Uncharacterized protein n=1 Tax=Giardia muris TaxID=5742 RepID=A0A4Z1SXN1_GIAMU|nr:hypothetical protein GMRT_10923 [Giardia muris]|eukprot:TNJ30456.1 hypothetical protein GMRT_10923 [Giardia muris]